MLRIVWLMSALALLAACSGSGPSIVSGKAAPQEPGSKNTGLARTLGSAVARALRPTPVFAQAGQVALADIAERAVASVVNISSEKVIRFDRRRGFHPFFDDPFFRHFFGDRDLPKERRQRGLGSGVIVDRAGIVLTNNHVIEKATKIRVTTSDGREFEAKSVGSDPATDLAVLKLNGDLGDLKPMPMGDSTALRLGEVVLAIGNPFELGHTVTMGIVSAKGRELGGAVGYGDFIQTDAAINPGNSGGALVDMRGQLVGINTVIYSRSGGYQGIGFAIPSVLAKQVMDSLLRTGKVNRGWLGVGIQNIDEDLARALALPSAQGVLITRVTEDSPAAKGGLKRRDVVLRVNRERADSTGKLRRLIAAAGANATVKLEVLRDGNKLTLKLRLGELKSDRQPTKRDEDKVRRLAGLSLEELDKSTRARYRIPKDVRHGVVIARVKPGSLAARKGLSRGDV
ncbi:MAG: Do family serine endopeptidase, partial [Proteobacteria bacterium]|nr:Do family serine endopeptidase [Pseudomonadota bacterium]